jgi:hypothetical protein
MGIFFVMSSPTLPNVDVLAVSVNFRTCDWVYRLSPLAEVGVSLARRGVLMGWCVGR